MSVIPPNSHRKALSSPRGGAGPFKSVRSSSSSSSSSSTRGPRTVPLLEAISRSPERSHALVQEVIGRWNAGSLIAAWVGSRWRNYHNHHPSSSSSSTMMKQRPGKRRRSVVVTTGRKSRSATTATTALASTLAGSTGGSANEEEGTFGKSGSSSFLPCRTTRTTTIHWLLTLLTSSSPSEQKAALVLLCQGCPVDDEYSLWTILQVLKYLIHHECGDGSYFNNTNSSAPPSPQHQRHHQHHHTKHDTHILPLVALLQHILLLPPPPPAPTCPPTSFLISRAFLKKGLSWITAMLWKATLEQKDALVAAFVHLLQQLLLFAPPTLLTAAATGGGTSGAGGDDQHLHDHRPHSQLLWNASSSNSSNSSNNLTSDSSQNSLSLDSATTAATSSSSSSPLISLIAAYHVLKQRKSTLTPRQQEVLSVLHQLVDPHTVPTTRSATTTTAAVTFVNPHNNNDKENCTAASPGSHQQRRRLWDTFCQRSPSLTSDAAAAVLAATIAAASAPADVTATRTTTMGNRSRGTSTSSVESILPPHDVRESSASQEEVVATTGTALDSGLRSSFSFSLMNPNHLSLNNNNDATSLSSTASLTNRSSRIFPSLSLRAPPPPSLPEEDAERENDNQEEEIRSGEEEEDDDRNGNHDEEENNPHRNSRHQSGEEEEEEEDEEMVNSHDENEEEDDDDDNVDEEDEENDFEVEDNNYDQDLVEAGGGDDLESAARAVALHGEGANDNPHSPRGTTDSHARSGGGMNHDEDDNEEEIDSDDDEDDDCEFDQEDEEEDEHDIVIHEEDDEDNAFRQRLLYLQDHEEYQIPPSTNSAPGGVVESRKKVYLKACHQVLATLYPSQGHAKLANHYLSVAAEKDLMRSILDIVHPPKKPANSKIIMRRAPTQEDFFRGSLSRNPISLQQIKKDEEPTVRDLRQHIANDLQMGDSAELIEILVANKILDVDLKLRVVHQVVWKQHLMQSQQGGSGVAPAGSALSQYLVSGRTRSLISSRSGLSMIFSGVGLGPPTDTSGNTITDDTPLAELPPMVITYRLTGVDGEATEDTVTTLEDPEEPSQSSDPKQVERQLEKEFGMTRQLTEGRGVYCLLKSVERSINDTLRRIRRDDVGSGENHTRNHFKTCTPYPGLTLLSCSAKLASNRELLLQSRAPTILLRLLLDVLHALEGEGLSERNPTAKELQELIEILASDMLMSSMTIAEVREEAAEDASTLRLVLGAIETSSLSRPLRNVIAKLLPYLTYGQPVLCKELASEFQRHFDETHLRDSERDSNDEGIEDILMATFIHTSIALPDNDVCNSLRTELVECGYVERIASFVLEHIPPEPPGWSTCLWAKGESPRTQNLLTCWQEYAKRPGLKTAFDMLIGLCKGHGPTQSAVGEFLDEHGHFLIESCHWLESTSDNTSARISMKPLGLAAETLLDELSLEGSPVAVQVNALRRKTRDRKKDIAMERRSQTLLGMGSFVSKRVNSDVKRPADQMSAGMRGTATSLLAPVLGLFGNSEFTPSISPTSKRRKTSKAKDVAAPAKPAWMVEMEGMEDETGLTCAVCQEGKTLQPSELLGLYAYVKKVSVPLSQYGGRNHIDGTTLLTSLPSLPNSLSDSHVALEWYPTARAIAEDLKESSRATLSNMANNRRATYFTTTVSAGNAIHFSCHNRARQVDRNHPKAPKSEWEGATLRNSRVKCNVIMPLVTSRSSQVPLVAVDAALTEHQTAISNLLGARPKSMLWNVLHDVRLLLLRMAHGEPLNTDCGGGSLLSNCQLVFHQLLMADMFEKDAQVDAPDTAQHARHLSAGFLAASAITHAPDYSKRSQSLLYRGMADSATMATLTCILFHNTCHDYKSGAAALSAIASSGDNESPHPKRRWILGRDYFLRGLINSAGRRHAMGIDGSGCSTTATSGSNLSSGSRRRRTAGFADWDIVDEADLLELAGIDADMGSSFSVGASSSRLWSASSNGGSRNTTVDDFKDALRPMIVYFAMMDQLSNDFVATLDDIKVEEFATHMVDVINGCNCCKTIRELLLKARVDLSDDEIMEELQKGMMAA